jgi:hypothetical protein
LASAAGHRNPVRRPVFVVISGMRRRIVLPPRHVLLIACAAALVGLVYAEGWIWPLKAAAVMIPVSFLVS